MRNGNPEESAAIKHAIEHGGLEDLPTVLNAVERTGALAHVRTVAVAEANLASDAIAHFADSPYKQAMLTLAKFSVSRTF